MLITTDAIVLRSIRYGDTSRIVTLYTRDMGKIGVIAKGARKPSGKSGVSRFGASLDVLSHCQVVLYFREGRDLQLLSQADLLHQFRGIMSDPARLMSGCAMLEYVNACAQTGEIHTELFDLLLVSLERLDVRDEHFVTGLSRFLLLLSSALGFGVDTEHCLRCRKPLEEVAAGVGLFSEMEGGILCPDCIPAPGLRIEAHTIRLIAMLGRNARPVPDVAARARQESLQAFERHLAAHVPGIRSIKSLHLMHMFDD